jgi:hypothetical protein
MAVVTPEAFVASRKSKQLDKSGRKTLFSHTFKGTVGPWAVTIDAREDQGFTIEELCYYATEDEARAFFSREGIL